MKYFSFLLLAVAVPEAIASDRYRFRDWLPYYDYLWERRAEACVPQIKQYHNNNRTGVRRRAVCAVVVDCLLTNVTESIKSNLASADILLGLTPQILSLAGPRNGELALLSTQRPVLTSLLSFGFPSMSISGLFVSVDVTSLLRKPVARTARAYHLWLREQTKGLQLSISTLQYALAAGAVANSIYTSVYLDSRTASGWRCGANYMPLAWSMSGSLIAMVEMLAIRTRCSSQGSTRRCPKQPITRLSWIKCHLHDSIHPETKDTCITEILFWIANFMSVIQTLFGTAVLSSLLFVSFLDALPILVRYGVSAATCNVLLRLELGGLRRKLEEERASSDEEKTRHFEMVERRSGWDLHLIRTIK